MFKKRTAATKKKGLRKAKAPGDSDEEEESQASSTLEQIHQTKKKRKLLTDVQYKRGVGADELLQQNPDAEKKRDDAGGGEPVECSSSSSNKDNVATSRDGILEQKHSKAMANYIEQQMGEAKKQTAIGSKNDEGQEESISTQDDDGTISKKVLLTKDALYAELAATSQRLAGKMNNNNNTDHHAGGASSSATISTDDLGSGGAVLIAGTGIAEVILPVEERLQVARDTEKAQQQHQLKRAAARKLSSSAAGSGVVAPRPQGLPNRFFIPSRPQTSHHATSDNAARANATGTVDEPVAAAAVDDDRLGFEGLKRQKEGPSGKKTTSAPLHHRDRANDLRVFRNFVSRERDKKK